MAACFHSVYRAFINGCMCFFLFWVWAWNSEIDCISSRLFLSVVHTTTCYSVHAKNLYIQWFNDPGMYWFLRIITCTCNSLISVKYFWRFVPDCPELRAPIHGSLSSSSRRNGAYVTVLCDKNYTLIGESIMKCVSGSWSETVGTCEASMYKLFRQLLYLETHEMNYTKWIFDETVLFFIILIIDKMKQFESQNFKTFLIIVSFLLYNRVLRWT